MAYFVVVSARRDSCADDQQSWHNGCVSHVVYGHHFFHLPWYWKRL
jgi:hypothetical protein